MLSLLRSCCSSSASAGNGISQRSLRCMGQPMCNPLCPHLGIDTDLVSGLSLELCGCLCRAVPAMTCVCFVAPNSRRMFRQCELQLERQKWGSEHSLQCMQIKGKMQFVLALLKCPYVWLKMYTFICFSLCNQSIVKEIYLFRQLEFLPGRPASQNEMEK